MARSTTCPGARNFVVWCVILRSEGNLFNLAARCFPVKLCREATVVLDEKLMSIPNTLTWL
jgi:hypothetical protein